MRTAQTQLLDSGRKLRAPASVVTMVTGPTPAPPTCPSPFRAHHGNQTCIAEAGPAGLHCWDTVADAAPIPRDSKMYSQRFGIVQREVKGPTPKVVIVVSTGCVCGTLLLSASPSTPGLAEPNLAPAVALSRGAGALCSGLNFERRKD